MQNRYKKLLSDTALFVISNFGSKVLAFLLVPLYTSVLETKEFGAADILTTTANVLYPIISFSIYEATIRFALDKKYNRKTVLWITLLFSLIAIIVLILFTPLFLQSNTIFGRYWWYFVGTFISITMSMSISYYIKGCDLTKIYAVQGIIFTVVYLLLNIYFLLIIKLGVQGYFISMILAYVVSSTYMVISSKCYRDLLSFSFDKTVCKEMLLYSIPMIPASVAWWINATADKYMILALVGVGANGLYGVAHKIPSVFSTFSTLFSQAWRISAISSFEESDSKQYYLKVFNAYSLLCIYFSMLLLVSSQIIAKILFRNDYYQAWICIPPLVISALFAAFSSFLYSIYAAAKKTAILSITSFVGALSNLILNYLFIGLYGLLGAAIATMLSFAMVWLITAFAMRSFMPKLFCSCRLVVTLTIVIVSGLYFSFQGPLMYIAVVTSLLLILLINLSGTWELTRILFDLITRSKKRSRR